MPGNEYATNESRENHTPPRKPKSSLVVRLIRFLWRRREWRRIRRVDHRANGPNWAEITAMIFTGGILIASSIQAGLYYRQADIMQRSLAQNERAMWVAERNATTAERTLVEVQKGGTDTHELAVQAKNQADETKDIAARALVQAKATNELATQARRAADSASESLQLSKELSREDRRAWVSAEVGENAGKFFIAMRNTGKTPAVNVTYVSAFTPGKLGVVPEVDLSSNSSTPILTNNLPPQIMEELRKQGLIPDHPPTGFTIAPGKSEIASYFGGEFNQVFAFPAETRVYIQGRFTYEDIFGQGHETRWCYWYASPTEFPACRDHNYMN